VNVFYNAAYVCDIVRWRSVCV